MKKITLLQIFLYLVTNRISTEKRTHVKPLVEAVVAMKRQVNTITNVASGSVTRTNPTKRIIMETVITLEKVFKRWEISGCANISIRNVDGRIPTPKGFMLSGRVIQGISDFWLIINIGSFQAPIPIMALLEAFI